MQTPPSGVTIVHDTVVFFISIHMNDCSCIHSCVASMELSMVRTYNIYISTYRTLLSVHNIFHMMSTLTVSHAASMNDTTDKAVCSNDGYYWDIQYTTYVHHMIFRGCNTHKIHYVAFYGAFTPSHVCLYTPSILNAI